MSGSDTFLRLALKKKLQPSSSLGQLFKSRNNVLTQAILSTFVRRDSTQKEVGLAITKASNNPPTPDELDHLQAPEFQSGAGKTTATKEEEAEGSSSSSEDSVISIVSSISSTDDADISEAFRNPIKLSKKEAQEAREAADRSTDLSSGKGKGKGKGKKNISHVASGTPPPQKRHKFDIVELSQ